MDGRKRPWQTFHPEEQQGWGKRACLSHHDLRPIRVSSFISQLNNLCTDYPQQLLPFLQNQCFLLGEAVQCPDLRPGEVYTLIRSLTVALEYAMKVEEVQPILTEVLQPVFIARDLLYFIAQIDVFRCQGPANSKVIENTVVLLHHLVTVAPEQIQQLLHLPVDLLYSKLKRQQGLGLQFSWITQKQLQDVKWMVDAGFPPQDDAVGKFMLPTQAHDFHNIPVFPAPQDIFTKPGRALRPNLKCGQHQSEQSYLDIHFRLLREDFIKPLRDGIASCFTPKPLFSGTQRSKKGLRLYNNVQIVKVGTLPTGVIYMAQFDTPFSSFVSSKRLMNGSLVCLISNDSNDVLFAMVVCFDRKELCKGCVWLDLKIDLQDIYKYIGTMHFTMVESPAFFEGYRHVLEGLQEMDHRLLPFRRYIVECNRSIYSPYYLDDDTIAYDLTALNPSHSAAEDKPRDACEVVTRPNCMHVKDVVDPPVLGGAAEPQTSTTEAEPVKDVVDPLALGGPAEPQAPPTDAEKVKDVAYPLVLGAAAAPQASPTDAEKALPVQIPRSSLTGIPRKMFNFIWGGKQPSTAQKAKVCEDNAHGPRSAEDTSPTIEPAGTSPPKEGSRCLDNGTHGKEKKIKMTAADPFNSLLWSPERFPQLDESQIKALQTALTREFVLIQGPPGTGKTFIGLKIVETLLRNDTYWNKEKNPILVVCYTNHALDQFLGGILQFQRTGVVRIGGRSKSKNMERYSLKNIRKERLQQVLLPSQRRRFSQIMDPLRVLKTEIPDWSAILETLHRGILSEKELELEINADQLYFHKGMEQSEMLTWLTITPKQKAPKKKKTKTKGPFRSSDRDSGAFQREADERYLDDYDYDDNQELTVRWLESKFAYIVPPNPSKSDAGILSSLKEEDIMSQEEVPPVRRLWSLAMSDRWRLYRKWLQTYKNKLKEMLNYKLTAYAEGTAAMMELTLQENHLILAEAKIIGMTTTGAAKYRRLLQKIEPKIVVVEEAAEVLEAHVLTTLNTSCEHLIMIGDHKQLRPKPADYTLEKKYQLGISLFERMIINEIPYVQLLYQHRMRPEISQLLVPLFYKHLKDHKSVSQLENIRGVDTSVFFVQHKEEEDKYSDSDSYSNKFEASFLVSLCQYLLKQNYSEEQITILTPYTGQLMIVRQKIMEAKLEKVAVKAVDDFQGEENDIILLSLVRSNKEGQIGFLKDKNRICVAFSRARMGFFCIGNLATLSEGSKSHLWKDIVQLLEEKNLTGDGLTLTCQIHPDNKTVVKNSSDLRKVRYGGCTLPCQIRLKCGHPCRRSCHPNDKDHLNYSCKFPCKKIMCHMKHECPKKCSQPCGPCCVKVEKILPNCGHTHIMPCYERPAQWPCEEPCKRQLQCKHACKLACKDDCSQCKCVERIDFPLQCNHSVNIECHKQTMRHICQQRCEQILECGHKCKGSCHECVYGRLHVGCGHRCTRVLLCSHVCRGTCLEICLPCEEKCMNKCKHSRCDKSCGDICFRCILPCSWVCSHYTCGKTCHEMCDRPRCNMSCKEILKCGHPCVGLCGEPCPQQCRVCDQDKLTEIFFGTEDEPDARFVVLEDCGHIFEVNGLDRWMDGDGEAQSQHVQMKVCPRCSVPIQWNTRYCNVIKEIRQKIDAVKQKIQGSKKEIEDEAHRLLHHVRSNKVISQSHEINIVSKLRCIVSLQGLKNVENTLNFFTSLSKLRKQAEKCTGDRKASLNITIQDMEHWLCRKRLPLTAEQLKQCTDEVKRISYLGNIFERLSHYEMKSWELSQDALTHVFDALEVLNRLCPFTEAVNSSLQEVLQKIDELLPVSGIRISEAERVMIITAMQIGKGHWYSCPKGHLYTVGECGRPMQQSNCPECGADIGGQNHNPAQGNATTDLMLQPLPAELLSEQQ